IVRCGCGISRGPGSAEPGRVPEPGMRIRVAASAPVSAARARSRPLAGLFADAPSRRHYRPHLTACQTRAPEPADPSELSVARTRQECTPGADWRDAGSPLAMT